MHLNSLPHHLNRFPLLDLGGGEATPDSKRSETMVYQAAESSIGDVGDLALTVQLDLNNTCEELSLPAPNSEQSTGKDGPQAQGWTKRYIDSLYLVPLG